MSNHFSAANLKHPGDDPPPGPDTPLRFAAPDNPDRTVLIMDVNPFMKGTEFHPDAVYRFNIDNDGDAVSRCGVQLHVLRTQQRPPDRHRLLRHRQQTLGRLNPRGEMLIEATPVSFDAMAMPVEAGPCRLFTGVRSDPFFADAEGVLHWLAAGGNQESSNWTGADTFGDRQHPLASPWKSPNDMLGRGPELGTWITVSLRRNGTLVQMDREGNPSFNPILNPDDVKNEFNATDPVDDVREPPPTRWRKPCNGTAMHSTKPQAAALTLLPDILHYDRTKPAHYPNGRVMTDDVFSTRMTFMTHGQANPQAVTPHKDLTAAFPFLGTPHP